jgi:hypothetical protein
MFLVFFLQSEIWGYPRTVPQPGDQGCLKIVTLLEYRVSQSQLNFSQLGPRYVPQTVPQLDTIGMSAGCSST